MCRDDYSADFFFVFWQSSLSQFTILTIILEAIVCQMNKAQENHQVETFNSGKHLPVTDWCIRNMLDKKRKIQEQLAETFNAEMHLYAQKNATWCSDIQNADKKKNSLSQQHINVAATSFSLISMTNEAFIIFAATTGNVQPQTGDKGLVC